MPKRIATILIITCLSIPSLLTGAEGNAADKVSDKPRDKGSAKATESWPQWRGPMGIGIAPDADPPIEWSEDRNIKWKVALPGSGHSTPVIWGDRIFITTAVPYGEAVEPKPDTAPGAHDNSPVTRHYEFVVLAVNRSNGKPVWTRTVRKELPKEGGHVSGTLASASPITDGNNVYAFFGSRGLYCLDMEGKVKWEVNLGQMQTKHAHGEGSSPVLHGDTLVVNWDHEGGSFVVAYDKHTGKQIWKASRDEKTSWSSPIVIEHGGKAQVIIAATTRVRSYDLSTGKVIWECGGLSNNVVASPVFGNGMVYVASSYDTRAMLAIRLDGAKGDITGTKQVVWTRDQRTPYVPSPLVYGDKLYSLGHYQGVLSILDAKTGKEVKGPFRLMGIGNVYASLLGAANRVYITDRQGATLVISHGDTPRPLALNQLDDRFSASPAVVGKQLFLRGARYLYCIEKE